MLSCIQPSLPQQDTLKSLDFSKINSYNKGGQQEKPVLKLDLRKVQLKFQLGDNDKNLNNKSNDNSYLSVSSGYQQCVESLNEQVDCSNVSISPKRKDNQQPLNMEESLYVSESRIEESKQLEYFDTFKHKSNEQNDKTEVEQEHQSEPRPKKNTCASESSMHYRLQSTLLERTNSIHELEEQSAQLSTSEFKLRNTDEFDMNSHSRE